MPQAITTANLRRRILLEARAHQMRQEPTFPEACLWRAIRASQLGVPFRRQVVIADYIVDFFAPSARLVVEVDGEAHHELQAKSDARRDRALQLQGLRVLRLPAQLVLKNPSRALELLARALVAEPVCSNPRA